MFANYHFYIGEFRGKAVSEEEFTRFAVRAGAFLNLITSGQAERVAACTPVPLAYQDPSGPPLLRRIQLAECAAVDALYKNEHGGGIASETVGKWTRNYVAGISTSGTDESRLCEAVRPFLAGTGLTYRGV